jgi:hypothetical protein
MPKERLGCFPDFKPEFYHYLWITWSVRGLQ